jgi:hypothetical protein
MYLDQGPYSRGGGSPRNFATTQFYCFAPYAQLSLAICVAAKLRGLRKYGPLGRIQHFATFAN